MNESDAKRPGHRGRLVKTALGTLGGALAGFLFYMLLGCTGGGG